jgi:hypothetical protein
LVNDASNRAVLGTLPAEQAEQRGHVLSKVRVDAHGAQHHDVAAIADRYPHCSSQPQGGDAECDEQQAEQACIELNYLHHGLRSTDAGQVDAPAHWLRDYGTR